jgi:branched-chain amino acid transport system ATP-binding protein
VQAPGAGAEPALLRLDRVSKAYGALVVIDDLSLEVPAGEVVGVGVIGPNGAGKTTLFNLVTGDAIPDRGRIVFAGHDITTRRPHARCDAGIGRTYQIPLPFTGMTVFENVLVGATFGRGRAERDADDVAVAVLRRTGLLPKANRLARSLTLLERKRLELARALATGPRLLLLDEIAGGLTEHEVAALVGTVRELCVDGIAIVWVEHVVHALVAAVDRLVVIHLGRRLADGAPREVVANPEVRKVYMGIEVG